MGSKASVYDAPVYSGDSGTVWTNRTGKILYQFVCDLVHTCGACLQYHLLISTSWPIPIHRRCRCHQVPLFPGDRSRPFGDFREILDGMSHEQQVAAIGASNYKILEAGLASWQDIVKPSRVLDLKEVVYAKGLTVSQMTRAGVQRRYAEDALRAARSSPAELLRQRRAELLGKIRGAGLSDDQIKAFIRQGIAENVGVGGGPSGPAALIKRPPGGLPPLPEQLRAALGLSRKVIPVAAKAVAKLKPNVLPVSDATMLATKEGRGIYDETMAAIDSVHGIPDRAANVPVEFKSLETHGRYQARKVGASIMPDSIAVSPAGETKQLTLAHEIGHYLDHVAIPGNKDMDRDHANDPQFKAWVEAVRESKAVQKLQEYKDAATKKVMTARDQKEIAWGDFLYSQYSYLLQADELWARSYAQWIAERSGNKAMLGQVESGAKKEASRQWAPEDFKPISEAIDGIFRKLGLLKE